LSIGCFRGIFLIKLAMESLGKWKLNMVLVLMNSISPKIAILPQKGTIFIFALILANYIILANYTSVPFHEGSKIFPKKSPFTFFNGPNWKIMNSKINKFQKKL